MDKEMWWGKLLGQNIQIIDCNLNFKLAISKD